MLISHWCHLIEGLQISPADFYISLNAALDRRQIPGLKRSRVLWPEGGLLSAKREYFCLAREKLRFEICAAPFGTGFFVSSRLVDREFPWFLIFTLIGLVLILLCLGLIFLTILVRGIWGITSAGLFLPLLLFALVGLLVVWLWGGKVMRELDTFFMANPVLGAWYERITRRNTAYRYDLVLVFKAAVDGAVKEAMAEYCGDQHLKPLSEFEHQPVMPQLSLR